MRKALVILMVLCVVGGTAAFADQLKKGEMETSAMFSYSEVDPRMGIDKLKQTQLMGAFGYLLTDGHEVGGELTYMKEEQGNASIDSTLFGVFYNYNFKAGTNLNPYVGAQVGSISGSGSGGDTSFSQPYSAYYGVQGGIKIYPWKNGGFNVGLRWDNWSGKTLNGIKFDDAKVLQLAAGILIKW